MVRHVSTVGNTGQAVTNWFVANLWTILIAAAAVLMNYAVNGERVAQNQRDLTATEQRLNERFTALSVRMTANEQDWQEMHDTDLQQTNDLAAFKAQLAADQQTRDVRSKARDDQIDAIQRDVRQLQDNDRLTGQWQATINERLVGVVAQLERISRILEQRLPDPPGDQRPLQRR